MTNAHKPTGQLKRAHIDDSSVNYLLFCHKLHILFIFLMFFMQYMLQLNIFIDFSTGVIMSGQGSAGNVLAALASFFIPGLGQLLQGRLFTAGFHFIFWCILWLIPIIGWVFVFLVNIYSTIDAALFKSKD